MVELNWFYVFILSIVFLPGSMISVSYKLSSLGIYHQVNEENETFLQKLYLVFETNVLLSVLFMPTYYILVSDTLRWESAESYHTFCFSALLTLVSLMTIRLLANHSYFLLFNKIPKGKSLEEVARERNEHTITHFHTLVCTAMILLLIVFSAGLIKEKSDLKIMPNLESVQIIPVFACFFIGLIVLTYFVERILLIAPPVIKTPYNSKTDNNRKNC